MTSDEQEMGKQPADGAWQRRMLPLMAGMIIVLTAFFFIASMFQLAYLNEKIWEAPRLDVSEAIEVTEDDARLRVLTMLEVNALERRYHQANVLLMSRVWARYLGFVTGMILALVGAVFILGKLRDSESELKASGPSAEFALKTASPGILLATLGVVLMVVTIVTNHRISTLDSPLYMILSSEQGKPGTGDGFDFDDEL